VPKITLINDDCFKVLPALSAGCYDCIVIDPPFFSWDKSASVGHKKPDINKLCWQVKRLLAPHGVIWLFGIQPQLANDWPIWSRHFDLLCEFVLLKRKVMPASHHKQPHRAHENLWVLKHKSAKVSELKLDFSKVAREVGEVKGSPEHIRHTLRMGNWPRWKKRVGYPKSAMYAQVLDGLHPTQKPLQLMLMVVECSTDEGDWVLDPFAGSGTTAVACKLLNRNCVAIEIDPHYYQVMVRRVEQAGNLEQFISESEEVGM